MKRITKSELDKVRVEIESRLETNERNVKNIRFDMDRIEEAFLKGGLSLDQFISDTIRKEDELNREIAYNQPLFRTLNRALYIVNDKLERIK